MPEQIFHYLLYLIVFQFRVCSYEYFLDRCTLWEINGIIEGLPYMDRALWESARLQAYIAIQPHLKNKIKQQDICKFKWEDDAEEAKEHVTEMSNFDIERLKSLSEQFKNIVVEDIDATKAQTNI